MPLSAMTIEKVAPKVTPLPGEQEKVVFEKIARREPIPFDVLIQALNANQTTLRADAATLLGDSGNMQAVPYLIDALSDESGHVGRDYAEAGMATTRYRANESLKKLTHQDFDYVWDAPKPKRQIAIQKWIIWWKKLESEYKRGEAAALNDINKGKYIYTLGGKRAPENPQLEPQSLKQYGVTFKFLGCMITQYDSGYRDTVIKALKEKYGFDPIMKLYRELEEQKKNP
ncbi:MAG: HEAT repeat domain-containing protein [Chthoniobacterales bacterium]